MWKKHIWIDGSTDDTSLMPSPGFSVHGINGAHSTSLFLLTKVLFDIVVFYRSIYKIEGLIIKAKDFHVFSR